MKVMAENLIHVQLVDSPIDHAELVDQAISERCGAVLLFLGTTRRWTENDVTDSLFYEAYEEMAIARLEDLAVAATEKFPIESVKIVHRLGAVPVCEASVAVVVASPHRAAAFESGEWLMDRLKVDIPIWKQDRDGCGKSAWVHPTQRNPDETSGEEQYGL